MQQDGPSARRFPGDPLVTVIQAVQRALVRGIEADPGSTERPAFEVAIDGPGREGTSTTCAGS